MRLRNLLTIIFPVIFFTGVLTIFYYLSITIENSLKLPKIPYNLNILSYILIIIGIILILSVFYLFDKIGQGTPVPKQVTPKLVTRKLVVLGPFKYTRNPMAIGFLLIFIGASLYFKSYTMLLLTVIMFFIAHLFIVHVEEKDMEQRFGKAYLEYKKKVPRWLPKFHS